MNSGLTQKRRAPRNNQLAQYKSDIAFSYCVKRWSIKEIQKYYEQEYGIIATHKQFEYLVKKWNLRKNIKAEEWDRIDREIAAREITGKSSDVALNGVSISNEQISRGRNRSITFTQRLMREADSSMMPRQSEGESSIASGNIVVATPPEWDSIFILPFSARITRKMLETIPISIAKDAITKVLVLFTVRRPPGPLDLSTVRVHIHPIFKFLRKLIYWVSNNQMSETLNEAIHDFLDKVEKLGCQLALVKILSQDIESMRFARVNLIPIFYLRECKIFLEFAYQDDNLGIGSLYKILENCMNFSQSHSESMLGYSAYPKPNTNRPIGSWETVFFSNNARYLVQKIHSHQILPNTPGEARLLLRACKFAIGDLSIFFDLWDPSRVPIHQFDIFLGYGRELYGIPLYTNNNDHLRLLLEKGFICFSDALLMRAILRNDMETANIIIRHLFPDCHTHPKRAGDPWDLIFGDISRILISHIADNVDYFNCYKEDVLFSYGTIPNMNNEFYSMVGYKLKMNTAGLRIDILIASLLFSKWETEGHGSRLPWAGFSEIPSDIVERLCHVLDILLLCLLSDTNHMLFFLGDFSFQAINSVLRRLLSDGKKLDVRNTWKFKIWEILCLPHRNKEEFTDFVKLLMETGIDINTNVSPDHFHCGQFSGDRAVDHDPEDCLYGVKRPIEAAFALNRPGLFLNLLSRGAEVKDFDVYREDIFELGGDPLSPSGEFLAALETRDATTIRNIWENRFLEDKTGFIDDIACLVSSGQFEEALTAWVCSDDTELNDPTPILRLCKGVISHLSISDSKGAGNYEKGIALLRSFVQTFESGLERASLENPSVLTRRDYDGFDIYRQYIYLIETVIEDDDQDRLEYFDLLLASRAPIASIASTDSHHWHILLDAAARTSRRSLELLTKNQELKQALKPSDMWNYCLFASVRDGKLDILIYVLEKGANIYSTGYVTRNREYSAVQFAAFLGRIDALHIFLEFDNSCWEQALKAIPPDKPHSKLMEKHIRDWKYQKMGGDVDIVMHDR